MKTRSPKGFTLIEMMVAVSIFVMVAFIVSVVFISMINAYQKAQNMKRIMENLDFALNTMAMDIREGVRYRVPLPINQVNGIDLCLNQQAGNCSKAVSYFLDGNGRLMRSINGVEVNSLTSSEIKINKLLFTQIGSPSQGTALIRVQIGGTAGVGGKQALQANFDIQTTLAQRNNEY